MTRSSAGMVESLQENRRVALLCCLALLAVILARTLGLPPIEDRPLIMDFDIFHIVGLMAQEGILADAYHHATLLAAQIRITGSDIFLPWAYPPVYTPIVEGLAHLPPGLGYGLFMTVTLAAWLAVVRALAGRQAPWVILMILPALLINANTGQNGYLTGALMGMACLLLLRSPRAAGLPLGAMVIKPHLALGLGLLVLTHPAWRRDWRVAGGALAVAAALIGASLWLYGPEAWLAFRTGMAEAGALLRSGGHATYRMTSAYGMAQSLGLGPDLAMALHVAVVLSALALVVRAARLPHVPRAAVVAMACAAGLLVSPYSFDYDLTVLGVALATAAPTLLARAGTREKSLLLALSWLACGAGFVTANAALALMNAGLIAPRDSLPSFGALALLGLLVLMARILMRPAAGTAPRDTGGSRALPREAGPLPS